MVMGSISMMSMMLGGILALASIVGLAAYVGSRMGSRSKS